MKYIVEIGAFVTYLRHRKLTIYAESEEEARNKAEEKFWKIMNDSGGDLSEATIENIEEA